MFRFLTEAIYAVRPLGLAVSFGREYVHGSDLRVDEQLHSSVTATSN
jgi:hypothetical protein